MIHNRDYFGGAAENDSDFRMNNGFKEKSNPNITFIETGTIIGLKQLAYLFRPNDQFKGFS